jgi:oligopeptide transport system ATP-binding protein
VSSEITRPPDSTLLEVENLTKHFGGTRRLSTPIAKRPVQAVTDVSFSVRRGATFALVGESGCGKSTTGRAVLRLTEPSSGAVRFEGEDIVTASRQRVRQLRRSMQMVFQDPYSSLNPRMRVIEAIREPMAIHGVGSRQDRFDRALSLFERVGLRADQLYRYPHEFSGGQRQRIGLARALALDPALIVADEPVSALDVSVQAQILNILKDLQRELGLTYLFISHDMSVVRYVADDVGVMYLGRLVETGPSEQLFADPLHPYTQALLSSVPVAFGEARPERVVLRGEIPSPMDPPSGCVFHTRCPVAIDACRVEVPQLRATPSGRKVACHLVDTSDAAGGRSTAELRPTSTPVGPPGDRRLSTS